MASNSTRTSGKELPPQVCLAAASHTSWFHGCMQRCTAVERLKSIGRPGAYLVRESQTFQGDYAISYLNNRGQVIQFRISSNCGNYFIGNQQFASLEALITHYSSNRIWKDELLRVPVAPPKPVQLYKMIQATSSYNKRNNSDELTLTQGEVFLLVNKLNERWGWGKSQWTGNCGLILLKFMKDLSNEDIHFGKPWFHGSISRKEAERLLKTEGEKGSFIFRARKSVPEQCCTIYSLSVRCGSKDDCKFKHYLISKSTVGYRFETGDDSFTYPSIEEIIKHYQKHATHWQSNLKLTKWISPQLSVPRIPPHCVVTDNNQFYWNSNDLHKAVPMYLAGDSGDKDGYLLLWSDQEEEWKNFYFMCDCIRQRLLYYDHAMMYRAKGLMDLRSSSVSAIHPSLFNRHDCLVVKLSYLGEEYIYYLAANSAELAQEWIKVIRQCSNLESVLKQLHFRLTIRELQLGTRNQDKIFIDILIDGVNLAKTMEYSSRNGHCIIDESFDFEVLFPQSNNCVCQVWTDQVLLGYIHITFSGLVFHEGELEKCYSLISDDQALDSASPVYLKLCTIFSNPENLENHGQVKKEEKDYEQLDAEFVLPERSPKKGFILTESNAAGLVYLPRGHSMKHFIKLTACETHLHPKLNANEVLLTQVVCISPCNTVFTPDKPAIIELMKIIKVKDAKQQLVLLFCDSSTIISQEWKEIHLHDCEILDDRISFTTTFFGYFAVIGRFCNLSASITIEPDKKIDVKNQPEELVVPELAGFKVEIPVASVQSPVEITATVYYDDPKLCYSNDQKSLATAFMALEPHDLHFTERIPIVMPIPNYAQIIDENPGIELELWHSTVLKNEQTKWEQINVSDFEITCDTEGNHVATVYTNHFSYYTYLWNKSVEYCMNFFTEKIRGRCQVFMSKEVKLDSSINFGIAILLYPFREPYKTLQNYDYILFDSEVPIEIVAGKLQCKIKLNDFLVSESCEYCKDCRVSKDFSARADFHISLNMSSEVPRGMPLANLVIKHGHEGVEPHEFNLIKPLKKEVSSIETSVDPVLQVKLPSLTSCERLNVQSLKDVQDCLWNARLKWRMIGLALGIDATTLEVIKRNNPYDNDAAFQEMLLTYLRNAEPVPCWKDLAQALMSNSVGATVGLDEELISLAINSIEHAIHCLYETAEQFEGDMVDSVEKVADYMMKMTTYARTTFKADGSDSKDDLVKSASLIAEESSNFAKMAKKMAEYCTEEGLKKAILQPVNHDLPLITRQLEIITAGTNNREYDPVSSQEAAELLTKNAQNLSSTMQSILYATERAIIRIPSDEIEKHNLKLLIKQVN